MGALVVDIPESSKLRCSWWYVPEWYDVPAPEQIKIPPKMVILEKWLNEDLEK